MVEYFHRVAMCFFARNDRAMIAATVQRDVDGIPERAHGVGGLVGVDCLLSSVEEDIVEAPELAREPLLGFRRGCGRRLYCASHRGGRSSARVRLRDRLWGDARAKQSPCSLPSPLESPHRSPEHHAVHEAR